MQARHQLPSQHPRLACKWPFACRPGGDTAAVDAAYSLPLYSNGLCHAARFVLRPGVAAIVRISVDNGKLSMVLTPPKSAGTTGTPIHAVHAIPCRSAFLPCQRVHVRSPCLLVRYYVQPSPPTAPSRSPMLPLPQLPNSLRCLAWASWSAPM